MATVSTCACVSLADVYALLLEDIRRNRAARLAAQREKDHTDADQAKADETQRVSDDDKD